MILAQTDNELFNVGSPVEIWPLSSRDKSSWDLFNKRYESDIILFRACVPSTKKISIHYNVYQGTGRENFIYHCVFQIPISTLKAVSGFLTNTAANTGVSVQKSATFKAGGYSGFSGNAGYSGHSGYSSYY